MDTRQIQRLASLEVNALVKAEMLPANELVGALVDKKFTTIHDLNGEPLFYRVPLLLKKQPVAYADIAANPAMGAVVLAFHMKMVWQPEELVNSAEAAAKKMIPRFTYDQFRFVAFSYPKIAVQFLKSEKEVAMIELYSGKPVPSEQEKALNPYNNRWSFIATMSKTSINKRSKMFSARVEEWSKLTKEDIFTIDPGKLVIKWPVVKREERVIHYSTDTTTHVPCFELVPQHTNVWCVAASTKMILDFYRFVYTQDRIAVEEELGTHALPNGLPYGDEFKVVNTIEKLSSNGLDATLNMSPAWSEFRSEILGNRPLISFIPGHSRSIAGYSQTKIFTWYTSRFLRLYDPWHPHIGVISWENYDAQIYRATFTIKPKIV